MAEIEAELASDRLRRSRQIELEAELIRIRSYTPYSWYRYYAYPLSRYPYYLDPLFPRPYSYLDPWYPRPYLYPYPYI